MNFKLSYGEQSGGKYSLSMWEKKLYLGNITFTINVNTVNIDMIKILEKYRGKGFGTIMINKFFEYIKTNNISKVDLIAFEQNEKYNKLVKFYNKFGFEQNGKCYMKYITYDDAYYRVIPMQWNNI
jgi:ribosomal protein S18 acetylase RimI-like enzyme